VRPALTGAALAVQLGDQAPRVRWLEYGLRRGAGAAVVVKWASAKTAGSPAMRIVGIAGSLRQGSYNRALLRAAVGLAPSGMTIEVNDLIEVPLYNADVEAAGDPPAVAALKQAIKSADGVLFVTPEYNHGVPGVMKNAVDWCSRPPKEAALNAKPVGIIGASPGIVGSARGQSQLRQAFEFTNSYCMPQPEILVFKAHEKFDAEGKLTDEATAKFLGEYLVAFEAWVKRFAG
jgi:chromate reductase